MSGYDDHVARAAASAVCAYCMQLEKVAAIHEGFAADKDHPCAGWHADCARAVRRSMVAAQDRTTVLGAYLWRTDEHRKGNR